jgi:DNA processing protein
MSSSSRFASMPAFAELLDPRDERPAVRVALHAWLALQARAALRPAQARALLLRTRDPVAALAALCGVKPAQVLDARSFAAGLAQLENAGARLLPFGASAYPARLAVLPDAAPLLGVRGDPASLAIPFVAIVGARAPTRLGLDVARRLGRELAEHGIGVVSGLARGIDAAAHRGALDVGGVTVAILGCGPEQVYPREHAALADEIAVRGAVLSELPVGAPPAKHHFPLRNRLISALSRAVVVVEARARSGSLVTARHAADQGRDVLAVPGAVDAPTSEGPNQLLRAGAWPVLDVSDVLAALGIGPASAVERAALQSRAATIENDTEAAPEANDPASGAAVLGGAARSEPKASEAHQARGRRGKPIGRSGSKPDLPIPPHTTDQRTLLASLRHDPASRDELAARHRLAPQALAQQLLPLELEGRVVEDRDGLLRVRRKPEAL